jgi:hypothetical protein
MPKVHNIGKTWFTQILKDYRVTWGYKVAVRGWTQEIEEPFRTSRPLIVRLPSHKALVLGRWSGAVSEEEALSKAIQRRDLTDDDFSEEKGWQPAPDKDSAEGWYDIYSRAGDLG